MAGAIAASQDSFLQRLESDRLPAPLSPLSMTDVGMDRTALVGLFESQIASRRLDLEARRLGAEKRGYYSIGSAGHEGNAAIARTFRRDDMAFLHYRSGAFYIERARKAPGETPLWNMALSFVASSDDPISGGRHKVIGSKSLLIPPQTSTIASHLPKAVGAAYAVALAKKLKKNDAMLKHDSVVICSFGDASANHSTAQGALNAAAYTAYRGLPLPIVFVCEDNGIGISVKTPAGWIASTYSSKPGLHYVYGDGRDLLDATRAAKEAERMARRFGQPVFLHLRAVRLMGHAGSDLETSYRERAEIETDADDDPLLHTARRLIEFSIMSNADIQQLYLRISAQIRRVMETACERPKLTTSKNIATAISPPKNNRVRRADKPLAADRDDRRAKSEPQHMSRLISLALAEQLQMDRATLVFGEDVAKKGGVYGATTRLQQKFGPARVFDTLLDEQSILGMAIGLAHNGFLPVPEIQFLAYVHNAEDQIRGEAATLSFFSNGQYANPMVIRIAGLAYQKGFGGHFHNDNSIAVFRDIPGVILACPSSGEEAVKLMRESFRLAREENRIVIFLEPIALYGVKDLYEAGDNELTTRFDQIDGHAQIGAVRTYGEGNDLAIVSYGNGVYFARRAAEKLQRKGVSTKVIDLQWLAPLPFESMVKAIGPIDNILIVDECRRTGSLSEEIMCRFTENNYRRNISRLTGEDCFIPLGPAANAVLLQEQDIVSHALNLLRDMPKKAAQ